MPTLTIELRTIFLVCNVFCFFMADHWEIPKWLKAFNAACAVGGFIGILAMLSQSVICR